MKFHKSRKIREVLLREKDTLSKQSQEHYKVETQYSCPIPFCNYVHDPTEWIFWIASFATKMPNWNS